MSKRTLQVTAQLLRVAENMTVRAGDQLMVVGNVVIGVYTGDVEAERENGQVLTPLKRKVGAKPDVIRRTSIRQMIHEHLARVGMAMGRFIRDDEISSTMFYQVLGDMVKEGVVIADGVPGKRTYKLADGAASPS